MSGSFDGINIARSALRAFQRELDITGNNISNVSTTGYSRQVADLTQSSTNEFWSSGRLQQYGTGVTVASVNRIRDLFLDAQMNTAQSDLGKNDALSTSLKQVEAVLNDTSDSGIGSALDKLYSAMSTLASNPSDSAARSSVQSAASTLTQRIKSAYTQISDIQKQFQDEATSTTKDIDSLTSKIASLNDTIRSKEAAGETPNSLLDERTQALSDLSNLVNIQTVQNTDGTVSVVSGQISLVDSQGSKAFPTLDAKTGTLTGSDGTTYPAPTSGRLAGIMQSVSMMGNGSTGYMDQLDTLANTLRTQFNSLMKAGTNANGTTGIGLFNDSNPQTGAADFDLSTEVKADSKNIAAGTGASGDGSIALQMSQLKTKTIAGLGSTTGTTLSSYYETLVGQVGTDSSTYTDALDTQSSVVDQINTQIQSISGVSLDDEMANMLRYQRSYQAAAKVLSIFDETTQEVIALVK